VNIFQDLDFDRISFWLGFLAGALSWWLIIRLKPLGQWVANRLKRWYENTRLGWRTTSERRLRRDLISYAQQQHLAAPIFPLEEIYIPVKILPPPSNSYPGAEDANADVTHLTFPYLPDMPELAAVYGAPVISLDEALSGDSHLILVGQPGCGRSVALAYLTLQILQETPLAGDLANRLPLLVNALDIFLMRNAAAENDAPPDTVTILSEALAAHLPGVHAKRRAPLFEALLGENRLLLLVDAMDELPAPQFDEVVDFLAEFSTRYPGIQIVVTATPYYTGQLTNLGFIPVALEAWDDNQRKTFIERWNEAWVSAFGVEGGSLLVADPALLKAWFLQLPHRWSACELTLTAWSLYAGDAQGPSLPDAIEAYVARMSYDAENRAIPHAQQALKWVALQSIITNSPFVSLAAERPDISTNTGAEVNPESAESDQSQSQLLPVDIAGLAETPHKRVLSLLAESGLLRAHGDHHYSINHPIFCGYLASDSLSNLEDLNHYVEESGWLSNTANQASECALMFTLAKHKEGIEVVTRYLNKNEEPLNRQFARTGIWLRYAPPDSPWIKTALRYLARVIQSAAYPMGLRARVLTALVTSGITGVDIFLRQLIQSKDQYTRQLAVLGLGILQDPQAIDLIHALFTDPIPGIRRAACLASIAIGTESALQNIAEALVNGDEELRRYAAEALANHPSEGFPTLEEGSQVEDLLIRRAVIFGLRRVRAAWSLNILKRMQIEDPQWIVKNAAAEAVAELEKPNKEIPTPLPPLMDTPWLIEFASQFGEGISNELAAREFLHRALTEGNERQKLAALNTIRLIGDHQAILPIYQLRYGPPGDLCEAAYNALWYLAAAGVDLPDPTQLGLELTN